MKAERNFYNSKSWHNDFLNKYSAIIKKKKKNKRQTYVFVMCT